MSKLGDRLRSSGEQPKAQVNWKSQKQGYIQEDKDLELQRNRSVEQRLNLTRSLFEEHIKPIVDELRGVYDIPEQDPFTKGIVGEILDRYHLYGESPTTCGHPQRPGLSITEHESNGSDKSVIHAELYWGIGRSRWGFIFHKLSLTINSDAKCLFNNRDYDILLKKDVKMLEDNVFTYIKSGNTLSGNVYKPTPWHD